jgi:DNA-binding SARP family transcriptional activator
VVDALEINLLGSFSLKWKNEPLRVVHSPRLQSLLAYLVLNRCSPLSRRQIAFQFWPDSSENQAFSNLRNLIAKLRHYLPEESRFLFIFGSIIQWIPDAPFRLDIDEFKIAAASGDLERAVSLYAGDLLPDCYEDWIQPERDRLREEYNRVMDQLIRSREASRDYEGAIRCAQAYLHYDPLRESTYRRLMRLYSLKGDRTEAVRVFNLCKLTLECELGVEPEEETRKVYEQLLRVTGSPADGCIEMDQLPMIDRMQEFQLLVDKWRIAASGSSRMLLLLGEAGIGKTRLIDEFRLWAVRQGVTVAYARCYASQSRWAYVTAADLLRSPDIKKGLVSLETVWLAEIARLLPELSTQSPDLPTLGPVKESWQQMGLFEALARGIFSAPPPVLLVVDDLQWADRETLQWLSYLVRFNPQAELLVIGCLRPEDASAGEVLEALRRDLQREGFLEEMELGPLNLVETQELVVSVSGHTCPPEVAQKVYNETEGNALFIVEMVRSMERRDHPEEQPLRDGIFQSKYGLSGKVEAVIASRVGELSGPAHAVAALGAACGRQFKHRVLAKAWKSSEDELLAGLDELWQRRIVREQGEESYDFSHDKIREAVYLRLSQAHRRILHRKLAAALESVHKEDIDTVSADVASHYMKAGLGMRALPYLVKAGEHSTRLFANKEAIYYLCCGADILTSAASNQNEDYPGDETVFRLLDLFGDVLAKTGQHQEAREAFGLIFIYLPDLDHVRKAQTHRKIGQTWLAHQGFKQMLEAYDSAVEALAAAEKEAGGSLPESKLLAWQQERLSLANSRMWAYYYLNEPKKSQDLADEVMPLVNQIGTPHQRAEYYACLVGMMFRRERYARCSDWVPYLRLALEASLEAGDENLIGSGYFYLGFGQLWAGEFEAAEVNLLESTARAKKTGDRHIRILSLTYLCVLLRKMDRVETARGYIERSLALATQENRDFYVGIARANQAWLYWKEDDFREAKRLAEDALDLWKDSSMVLPLKGLAYWPLIEVSLKEGELEKAIGYAKGLFSPEQQVLPPELAAALEKAIQCWDGGQIEEARQYLTKAAQLAVELSYF